MESFDNDFFAYDQRFEQVPSQDYSKLKLSVKLDFEICPLCRQRFSFSKKMRNCHDCSFCFCSDCMKNGQCQICYAIDNNPPNFNDLTKLNEYKSTQMQITEEYTPKQIAILVFLKWLQAQNIHVHEYAIRALYNKRDKYVNDLKIIQVITRDIHKHLIDFKDCKRNDMIMDLLADLFIIYKKKILSIHLKYEEIIPYLTSKDPNISAAAARLALVGAVNKWFKGDQEESINFLSESEKAATAFILASIAADVPEPPLFGDSFSSGYNIDPSHVPKLVEMIMNIFDDKRKVGSIASHYFSSIILLNISTTPSGANELIKYLPLTKLIEITMKMCPRTLGMTNHTGRISVYLLRTVKNVLLYCKQSQNAEQNMAIFVPELINLIFDLTESQLGYNKYSYFCIVQTIAIELAEEIQSQPQYKSMLSSDQIKDKLNRLKEERTMAEENENQINFGKIPNQQMGQLTQEQILQLRESSRIRSQYEELKAKFLQKEAEAKHYYNMLETQRNDFNNKISQANALINQRDLYIKNLNQQIAIKQNEIENATQIIKAREAEIQQLRESMANQ